MRNETAEFQEFTKNLTEAPSGIPAIPGMVSVEECKYLYTVTSSIYAGKGDVVEIGSWLGKSANYLAAGIAKSGHNRKLHCFDDFQWTAVHSKKASKKGYWENHSQIMPGENFLSHFEANTARYKNYIIPHKTYIKDIEWI